MLRRAFRGLGLGVIILAAALYIFEFVASDFVTPRVTMQQWAILALALFLVVFLKNRDQVVDHHLPH